MTLREQMDSSFSIKSEGDGKLKHNEEEAGVIYKYDLPVENLPITFKKTKALI